MGVRIYATEKWALAVGVMLEVGLAVGMAGPNVAWERVAVVVRETPKEPLPLEVRLGGVEQSMMRWGVDEALIE